MAVKIAARRAANVAVNCVHSMAAHMADCLAERMILMQVGSPDG